MDGLGGEVGDRTTLTGGVLRRVLGTGGSALPLAGLAAAVILAGCGRPEPAVERPSTQAAERSATPLPVVPQIRPVASPAVRRAPAPVWQVGPASPRAMVEVSPDSVWLLDGAGERMVELSPTVWAAYGRTPQAAADAAATSARAGAWKLHELGDGMWTASGRVVHGGVDWTLRLSGAAGDPRIRVEAVASVGRRGRYVGQESVELRLVDAQKVAVLGRDYVWKRVTERHVVGRWTPQLVSMTAQGGQDITILGEAPSMVVQPAGEGAVGVRLEVDNAKSHPIRVFQDCWQSYGSSQEKMRDHVGAAVRRVEVRVGATVVVGDVDAVRWLRFPHRYRSALSFTDHADQSNVAKLGALMFGETGAAGRRARPGAPRGFVGHGLAMTKTIFQVKRGKYAAQGSSAAYRDVLKAILDWAAPGMEIGLHSASGLRDTHEETARAVAALGALQPTGMARVWVDHQPSTNCEAMSNEGAGAREGASGTYEVASILKAHGYGYVWAGFDERQPRDRINLFDPKRPGWHRPVLYTHPRIDDDGATPLWIFSSVWRALAREAFLRAYEPARLDTLVAARGLHIAHTYLDTHAPSSRTLGSWTLLEKTGSGYRLRPEADGLFAELARRQKAKKIWVAGVGAIGDHMRAMTDVAIRYEPDGSVVLTYHGSEPLEGASFLLPSRYADAQVVVEGAKVSHGTERDGLAMSLDFRPGQERRVIMRDQRGQTMAPMKPAQITVRRAARGRGRP